jgi:hypothetical protein
MQELAERAISELHGTHFDIRQPARRIEARQDPTPLQPVSNGCDI